MVFNSGLILKDWYVFLDSILCEKKTNKYTNFHIHIRDLEIILIINIKF